MAGFFEVVMAFCLGQLQDGDDTRVAWWLTGFLLSLATSMYLLYRATQVFPLGTAYAVWTGIGAVGTVIIGIVLFKEPSSFWRLFFTFTLIVSIIGLKVVSH